MTEGRFQRKCKNFNLTFKNLMSLCEQRRYCENLASLLAVFIYFRKERYFQSNNVCINDFASESDVPERVGPAGPRSGVSPKGKRGKCEGGRFSE